METGKRGKGELLLKEGRKSRPRKDFNIIVVNGPVSLGGQLID